MGERRESRNLLTLVLIAAFLSRAALGFISLGADHPNETYRLLEPLAAGWGFATRLPWEWTGGLLSVLPVRVLSLWLAPFGESSLVLLQVLKLTFAALSLVPIVAAWRMLIARGRGVAIAGAAFVAFWPEFIYRSVRLMDYTLEAALLAGAVIFAFTFAGERVWRFVLAGVLLGLAFFVRFQSGLYFIAFLAAFALARRRPALGTIAAFVVAYGVTIFALAGFETDLTGAGFLSPFVKYVQFNWFDNGAAKYYGVAPWHRYLSEAFKAYGMLPFLAFAALAVCESVRGERRGVLFFLPFVVLSLLGHKEGRFAYGFLWLLAPLALATPISGRAVRGVLIGAVVIGLGLNVDRVARRIWIHADDVRQWAAIGRQIAALPDQSRPTFVVVQADPDAVPGG